MSVGFVARRCYILGIIVRSSPVAKSRYATLTYVSTRNKAQSGVQPYPKILDRATIEPALLHVLESYRHAPSRVEVMAARHLRSKDYRLAATVAD